MGKIKLLKGSEEFELFQDYWNLLQENWQAENNDAYWQKAISDCQKFYQKYNTPFAKDLSVAYMSELERRSRSENISTG